MKVVINTCYGGFSLSNEAFEEYLKIKGITYYRYPGILGSDDFYTVTKEEVERVESECREKKDFSELNKLYLSYTDIEREDPVLVEVVEKLKEDADGYFARLKIVEVPDDVQWSIEEYDGSEWVAEIHRTWS